VSALSGRDLVNLCLQSTSFPWDSSAVPSWALLADPEKSAFAQLPLAVLLVRGGGGGVSQICSPDGLSLFCLALAAGRRGKVPC